MDIKSPVKSAGGIYKRYASYLEKLGIITFEDFLYHVPARYEDFSIISNISQAQQGEIITIQGKVLEIKNEYTRNYKKLQKAKIADETGIIETIWFNQPFLVKNIHKDDLISISGRIVRNLGKLIMESPEYEVITGQNNTIHTGRLVPVYPETRGVSSKWIRRQVYMLLEKHSHKLTEYLPCSILENNRLIEFGKAIKQIHFPEKLEDSQKAKQRLAFDELFLMQIAGIKRRKNWEKNLIGHTFSISEFNEKLKNFTGKLPFTLTNAQKRVIKEIFNDFVSSKPMNRLLEGDVGSGKTIVAGISMYLTYLNGFQSVLMAPTEILARQHHKTISTLLEPLGVKVEIITGNKKIKNNESRIKNNGKNKNLNSKFIIHNSITNTDILIGTHAVLSEKIKFDKLGLVVIDEQQRFGVEQRAIIRQKGQNPHLLTMTATPIPRTIALTMYGDLDLSYIDEMPIGRKIIKTWLVPPEKRQNAYKWIEDQIKQFKSQAFVICPFIEESESMQTVKASKKEYERLKKEVFKNLKLGLLHGKLKSKEKDAVLQSFKNKEFDILVATPVVEVGIDIPNATIILIEAAERFGLSQLHQLRGRVGRGDKQSYCLLFTESKNELTTKRLKAMETMQNGADLAELDLKLRGPGVIYGTKQHGMQKLKVASFSDFSLIEQTRREAEKIFPDIHKFPLLVEKLNEIINQNVSPD